jgi:hypothetical protein
VLLDTLTVKGKSVVRIRYDAVFFSSVLLSIGLLSFVPASLHWASTWREINIEMPGFHQQNYFMPLGFYSLGFEMIGLIVLWTGYRRRERQAWFVMLIITSFFVFPLNGLKLLLDMRTSAFGWSDLLYGVRAGWWPSIWMAVGAVTLLVMLVALLLPIKAFFCNPTNPKAAAED